MIEINNSDDDDDDDDINNFNLKIRDALNVIKTHGYNSRMIQGVIKYNLVEYLLNGCYVLGDITRGYYLSKEGEILLYQLNREITINNILHE